MASKSQELAEAAKKRAAATDEQTNDAANTPEVAQEPETRISKRTEAEMSRGKEVLAGHAEKRARAQEADAAERKKAAKGTIKVTDEPETDEEIAARALADLNGN